jgi:2-polyprenyl-3-methyl-5-hydroxy-6-metoxy-1,4-benzoquinol methylase
MPSIAKPDYASHDEAYQKLKARGTQGWSSAEEYEEMLEAINEALLNRPAHRNVLELGCGAGNLSLLLNQQGYQVTGVDISETAIGWAREHAQASGAKVAFRVDNVLDLASCRDEEFDVVIDGHCLHCIIGEDRARCLSTVRRVLKPGGLFIVLTMCGEVRNERLLPIFDPASRLVINNGRPTRYIGRAQDIAEEIRRAGFAVPFTELQLRLNDLEQDDFIVHAIKT